RPRLAGRPRVRRVRALCHGQLVARARRAGRAGGVVRDHHRLRQRLLLRWGRLPQLLTARGFHGRVASWASSPVHDGYDRSGFRPAPRGAVRPDTVDTDGPEGPSGRGLNPYGTPRPP